MDVHTVGATAAGEEPAGDTRPRAKPPSSHEGHPRVGGTHGSRPREPAGFQNVLYPWLGRGHTSIHVYEKVSDYPLEVPTLTLCKFYLNKEVKVYDTQIYRAGRIRQER